MRTIFLLLTVSVLIISCETARPGYSSETARYSSPPADTIITQSLFNDRAATISEADIRQILNGSYQLPQQLRVAIVKLNGASPGRFFWNDEEMLKAEQAYANQFRDLLHHSEKVKAISFLPDFLLSRTPSFTSIREAAVRMQADIVLVYSITSDIYSKYKLFSRSDIKAFATTQAVVLDVRTGLIPFSLISTKDFLSQKTKEELDIMEARGRVQREAVGLTITDIGAKLFDFLEGG